MIQVAEVDEARLDLTDDAKCPVLPVRIVRQTAITSSVASVGML